MTGLSRRWLRAATLAALVSVMTACLPLQTGKPTYRSLVGPLKRVTVGKVDFAYYRFGKGRPLVLVMGITGTMTQWDPKLLARLARKHEIVIFDNPGIGLTRYPADAPLTIPVMASATVGLIGRLGLGKPDILGWSMGGEIALAIAALHGDRVRKVIAAAGHAGSRHLVQPTTDALARLTDPKLTGLDRARILAGVLFPDDKLPAAIRYGASIAHAPKERVTAAMIARQKRAVAAWKAGPGIWNRLPAIRNRVLIAHGMDDRILPAANAILLAERIPASWLARFPNSGHAFLFQEADRFADLVEVFLRDR